MSLNKVKSMKSKLAGAKLNTANLQLKLRKLKSKNRALFKGWQETTEEFAVVEKGLKLQIENGENKRKEVITRLNNIVEKLKENLECPVCMDIPRSGPMPVCPNGHFVCKNCKTGSCPTCRVDMGNGKSLLAMTVIENIDHKCKFAECEEVFAMDKLLAHEKICDHRIVRCPHSGCNEDVALSKLLEHLGKKLCSYNSKPDVIDNSSKAGKANFTVTNLDNIGNHEIVWKVYTYSYRDINFAICARKVGDYYHFTMVMFESETVCSKYKIAMEVHEQDSLCQDAEIGIRFRGNPCSIEQSKSEVKFHGLSVHHKVMEKMIKTHTKLPFTVSFSFSEKRSRSPGRMEDF